MEPPCEYLPGHAELAAYISIDPDFQIYKRFTRLSARNLLYLQSELASLSQWFEDFDRAEQQRLESTSMEEKMDVLYRTQSWSAFMSHADKGGRPDASEEDRRQAMKLRQIERLRKATAEYQDALIRQNACLSIEAPARSALAVFREWYKMKAPLVGSHEQTMLDDDNDLLCVKKKLEQDRLLRILREHVGFLFGWLQEEKQQYPRSWGRVFLFREQKVENLTAITSILLAAILLVGSVVALYFVDSAGARLGLLGAFVFLFAASIGLLSNAKRSDLFAATAAYAAVLVVFVSGNFGNGQRGS